MTECTEVSYVVPSYFFLRCRKPSEDINRVQKKTAVIGLHSESYHAVFFGRGETQHFFISLLLHYSA